LEVIRSKKEEVSRIIRSIHNGTFENKTSRTNQSVFEERVNTILNSAINDAGRIGTDSLSWDNRMTNMVKAGSKGKTLNISQMMACVGQVNVDGQRIPYGFDGRTLPHFQRYDDSPEARGFVENSFVRGLTPTEFFFHAQSGREGLIDTAVKTSATGYVQRQMIKAMEDLKVHYDQTVRTANGSIVQMAYGEDGMDSTRVISQFLPSLEQSVYQIYNSHAFTKDDVLEDFLTPDLAAKMREKMPELIEKTRELARLIVEDRDIIQSAVSQKVNSVNYPIPFERIIKEIMGNMRADATILTNLSPFDVLEEIEALDKETRLNAVFGSNDLMMALTRVFLSPRVLIREKRVTKEQLNIILLRIRTFFEKSLVHPGEMVGVVSAQSIGEPATQMTLNSFHFKTELLVKWNGILVKKTIGDLVENYFLVDEVKTEEHPNDTHLVYTSPKDTIEILSPNLEGIVKWRKVEAMTKHPVVNKDGTNTLIKVNTRGGREVIATKAKSFVRYNKDTKKLEQVMGEDIQVGDLLPIHSKGFEFEDVGMIDIKKILSPYKYIYGSEMEKAKMVINEKNWWKNHFGTTFEVPYSRSDSCYSALKSDSLYKSGFIYPAHSVNVKAMIPEKIKLDWKFGYFIGAYCAEGCATNTQISIANNDIVYLQPIIDFCEENNITYKIYRNENKTRVGWTSQDIRIYSTVLTDLIVSLCGKMAHGKTIHESLICGSKEFLSGICSAYFGGDGTVSKNTIYACSVSKELLEHIQLILLRLNNIYSTIHNHTTSKNIKYKQAYTLAISNGNVYKFIDSVNLTIHQKELKFQSLRTYKYRYEKNKLNNLIELKDIMLDDIVSIVEVSNDRPYVYDLTVEDTRIFQSFTGLALNDTFHLSGVAEKSNVTRGVPRLNEILHLSKNLKSPSITVFLEKDSMNDRAAADAMRKKLVRTKVADVVKIVRIAYDPRDYSSPLGDSRQVYHWKLQLIMDAIEMHERDINMEDVNIAISKGLGGKFGDVLVQTSDMNADELVVTMSIVSAGEIAHDDSGDPIRLLRDLETIVLEKVVIRGIRGIEHCVIRKMPKRMIMIDQEFKEMEQYVVDTVGTNLLEVLGTPGVDATRTFSNHILEINQVLGIDAARNSIIRELNDVFETYINYHHLSLLADKMTSRGVPISIDRHGVNKSDSGPLAKASFEETDTVLLKAAQMGELDPVTGVTSNIMFGQPIPGGTGMSQILLDEDMFMKVFRPPRDISPEDKAAAVARAEEERKAAYCDNKDIRLHRLETGASSGMAKSSSGWLEDDDIDF
jgi:DNA-directed RNA polymerase beta' subunit